MNGRRFAKLHHRNGAVFLRIVNGLITTVCRMSPADAAAMGERMIELAARAAGKRKRLKFKEASDGE